MAKKKEITVNHNLLNLISPTSLIFEKNRFMIGENYARCVTISKFPQNPECGWLAKICQIEGVTASIEFIPTESGPLIDRCNEQIRQYRIDLQSIKDESVKQAKEQAIEDIRNMIQRVHINKEVVGYVNIILLIQATTEEKLEERYKKVVSIVASIGGSTRVLSPYQKEAYLSAAPYGLPNEKLQDIGARNMPLSTFIGGFPNAANTINDGIGILIAKTEEGKPIIIDTWKRGGDRTNSNWFISGESGIGKTTTIKFIIEMEYALGTKIIITDPEREFIKLTLNLGGKVINACGGPGGRINPLQVRPAPRVETDDELEDDYYRDEGKGVSDLALHFQTHRTFIKLYRKDMTDYEIAKLEEIMEKTYKRFDITWDTDVTKLKNTDFPIYSDLYEDIEKEAKKNPDDPVYTKLLTHLRSIAKGADSFIFNGHTDIEADADIIDLDIGYLLEADENVLRAQFHNINTWVWQQAIRDRKERILYVMDEGYLIVDPDNPEPMKFVRNFAKRIRKYEGGIMFIVQSVVDVLDPAVKRYGQAIIDNACYKFIMGTDGKNLEETKKLFNLTEAEEDYLLAKQRGRGLLFVGSNRIGARIDVPDRFLELMGTAGGR